MHTLGVLLPTSLPRSQRAIPVNKVGTEQLLAIFGMGLTEYLNLKGNDWKKFQEKRLLVTVTSATAEEKRLEIFFPSKNRDLKKTLPSTSRAAQLHTSHT